MLYGSDSMKYALFLKGLYYTILSKSIIINFVIFLKYSELYKK